MERSQPKQWLHTVGPDCELSIQHGVGPFVSFRGQHFSVKFQVVNIFMCQLG